MIIETINSAIGSAVPFFLIFFGIFFAFKLRLFWLRHPLTMIRAMTAKRDKNSISPFRAVTMALAGTLGVGNIVGVAGAIAVGGFGAVFWMWVSALFAMVLKYAEIVLAVSHRRVGRVNYGGAVYYIRDLLSSHDRLGAVVAGVFSVLMLLDGFTTGSTLQINAAARSAQSVCGIPTVSVGIFAAVLTVAVVLTGAQGVSKLTEILIPLLSLAYILMSLAVLILRSDSVIPAFSSIFCDAFRPASAAGGVLGFLSSRAVRFGSMRGLLSNEAGCGTAPTAHAAAETDSPVEQGFWGIFEVFVDTIVLCTLTALVIIINYDSVSQLGNDGIMMAIRAYSATLGEWSEYVLAGSVSVFGIATVLCWAHYGRETVNYLFGNKKLAAYLYLIVYAVVTVIGATVAPDSVWGLADLALGSMTLINLGVLFLGRREISVQTKKYFDKNAHRRR